MPQHVGYSSSVEILLKQESRPITLASSHFTETSEDGVPPATGATMVVPLRPHSPDLLTLVAMPPLSSSCSSSSSSRESLSEPLEDEKDSIMGQERQDSVSSAGGKTGTKDKAEKRKRSRVTPSQLQHLERFFMLDRSPTAARRKEISELLGMQERQTQIWFQNRRAKAKLQDGRQPKGRSVSIELPPPPNSPPRLSTSFQADLHNLIHEDEPVTIIPCTDLTIGSWRRIATTVAKHDLVAYVCDVKRCLTWFIHSVGFGFKMEIPFSTIVETEFTNAAPGSGQVTFLLSEPPLFYVEHAGPSSTETTTHDRHWKRCGDWTEGQQATRVLCHDLVGSAVQLSHLLRGLRSDCTSNRPLHPPSYRSKRSVSPVPPVELPPPPMANMTGPAFEYQHHDGVESSTPHPSSCFQKPYASSGANASSPDSVYSYDSDRPPPYSTPAPVSVAYVHQQSQPHHYDRPASASYGVEGGSVYADYYISADTHQPLTSHHQPVDDFAELPISQDLPRPYSAQAVPRSYYTEVSSQVVQAYPAQSENLHMQGVSMSTSTVNIHAAHSSHEPIPPHLDLRHRHHFISPSPPLLTTPYHPPPHLLDQSDHLDQIGSVVPPPNPSLPAFGNANYQHHQHY